MSATFRSVGYALAFAMAGAAPALQAATVSQDALQRFVDKVETLHARFEQVQKDERGQTLQTSSGQLWLARPGKFRWSYETPYEQLVVCDGATLWLYDPDLAQVTVRPAGATLQGTPAQLLTDRAALAKHFRVESPGKDGAPLRLVPRAPDSDFARIELWLVDDLPQRMRFHDPLGGVNEVTFHGVRANATPPPGTFGFTVPPGVEVISAQ